MTAATEAPPKHPGVTYRRPDGRLVTIPTDGSLGARYEKPPRPPEPALVAIAGRQRAGKDTAASALQLAGFARVAFADPVRAVLADLDPYVQPRTPTLLASIFGDDTADAESEAGRLRIALAHSLNRHVGILPDDAAAARAVAAFSPILTGSTRLSDLLNWSGGDWDRLKNEANPQHQEVRRLLQRLGTESIRGVFGDRVWVDAAMDLARRHRATGRPVVISDCRFDVEARAVHAAGGIVVRVDRPGLDGHPAGHSSEAGICPDLIDETVTNDGTILDLHARIARTAGLGDDDRAAR